MKRLIRAAQYGLITAGILALGYCLMAYLEQRHFQLTETRRFGQNLQQHRAAPKATIQHGAVLGDSRFHE
jgi:hypothetical protein